MKPKYLFSHSTNQITLKRGFRGRALSFLVSRGSETHNASHSGGKCIDQLMGKCVWQVQTEFVKSKIRHSKYKQIHVDEQRSPNLRFIQNQVRTLMNLVFPILTGGISPLHTLIYND